jgi:hypothetical protein
VPTYETKVAGGDTINLPMDEVIAKNKDRMDEWNAYSKLVQMNEARFTQKWIELLIWEGIDLEVPDKDSEWQKTSEYFGLTVPDNPIERKLFYVYNEFLGTTDDLGELVAQISIVSQIDEDAVAKLRDSFRHGVQGQADKGLRKKQRRLENKKSNVQ